MKKIIYEQIEDDLRVNNQTGEIINQESTTEIKSIINRKIPNEPDYVKFYRYVNTLFAFKGIKTSLTPFIIEISNHMTYAKEGQIVNLNKITKTMIADNLQVSIKRLDQVIAELKKVDILRKIQNGVYSVNPYIVARGTWADIRSLQTQFDYNSGEMLAIADIKDKITGQDIRKAITNSNKQVPGQLSLFDNEIEIQSQKPQETIKKQASKNSFNNFPQNQYDFASLEEKLLEN